MLSQADFADECRRFLEAHAARRDDSVGAWGVGSDEITVYAAKSPERSRTELDAARAWRRCKYDHGFGWITGPPAYGGRGLPASYEREFLTLEAGYDVPSQTMFGVGIGMIAPTILRHGPEWMHERYLAALHRGDVLACQFLSEPDAGSDLASVRTTAVPDGDEWVLNGQKVWSSNAHRADIGILLARSSPDKPKHRGLTAFLVPTDLPGVTIRPLRQITGSADFNESFFTEVRLSDRYRLGAVDEGWSVIRTTLGNERAAIGAGGAGYGGAGLAGLVAPERIRQLIEHLGLGSDPTVRQDFARLVTGYELARYVSLRTAAAVEAGREPGPWTATAKLALTTHLNWAAGFVARLLGPRITADSGEWGTFAWSALLYGAAGTRIGGGTDEILRNTAAENVLGLPRG